jgi:Cu(I)/Ag(I) efflux system membrane fusion protein/cobalt-zinc-cadmium efflux system membrane fusion protein
MNKHSSAIVGILVVVAAAGAGAAYWMTREPATAESTTAAPADTMPARPRAAGEPVSHELPRGDVALDLRRRQLIGVRTAHVVRETMAPSIRVVGTVRYDETRQAEINTRIDGWIRELHADYTGKPITKGEPLFTLYSPELVTSQNEYLLALRGRAASATAEVPAVRDYSERLVQAARERLMRCDVSAEDIAALETTGTARETITFRAPMSGIIGVKFAVEGMRVMAGQALFRVADLSTVWIEANIPERDMGAVRIGQTATMTIDAYPGETFTSRASFINTSVDEAARSLRVRFVASNPRGRLRPGMFANLQVRGAGSSALTVPADAILDSGSAQIVFVDTEDGSFTPRPVRAGRRMADRVEIVEGLKEGEKVATGANFFIDSESQLRAGLQNYEPGQMADAGAQAAASSLDVAFRSDPDPPRTGESHFEVSIKDSGTPMTDAEVSLLLFMPAMPSMNMPAMRFEAPLPHAGGGVYRGPAQVMMAGRWDVTVAIGKGGKTLTRKQFAIVAR